MSRGPTANKLRILWLLPDLSFTSAARQAVLLAPELARLGHQLEVGVLRSGGAFTSILKSANVVVHELSTPHHLPGHSVQELNQLLQNGSWDLVHAWRMPALRAMAMLRLSRGNRPRLVVSQTNRGGHWPLVDRWMLKRADCIAADLGESSGITVPLAVRLEQTQVRSRLPVPEGARVILGIGELTGEHGFRDAIWGFDVLKFVYDNLYLVIIGDGPEHERLTVFANRLGTAQSRSIFVSGTANATAFINLAEVVWVPSRKPCGEQVVLESQAAGVPVVTTNLPSLAALVSDGQTGMLVPKGDPVRMAMVTRPILDECGRGRELAAAAKLQLADHHEPSVVAACWSKVYAETCSRPVAPAAQE